MSRLVLLTIKTKRREGFYCAWMNRSSSYISLWIYALLINDKIESYSIKEKNIGKIGGNFKISKKSLF